MTLHLGENNLFGSPHINIGSTSTKNVTMDKDYSSHSHFLHLLITRNCAPFSPKDNRKHSFRV